MTDKQTKRYYDDVRKFDYRSAAKKHSDNPFKQELKIDAATWAPFKKLEFESAPAMLRSSPLTIAQATLGERIQGLAGDPNRRGAKPWWQSGWKSEGEAVEALQNNPELIQHFDNQPGFPKDLFKQ